jgi:hypothetical protein
MHLMIRYALSASLVAILGLFSESAPATIAALAPIAL